MTEAAFRNALEDILQTPRGALKDSDNRETVQSWSSIADVQILTTITAEFGLEPDATLLEAETIGDMINILRQRSAFSD